MPRKHPVERSYYAYTKAAEELNHEWQLSCEQFEHLIKQPCHYCGDLPLRKLHDVDRVDNSVGYLSANCVTCCKMCNMMKYRYTTQEFIEHCKLIVRYNKFLP